MTLGPILPGRLPGSLTAARLNSSLQANFSLLQSLQDQISTGHRFFLPGESPAAATRAIVLQKAIERQEQLQTNIATSRSFLAASEGALAAISESLNRAKSLALAGLGSIASPGEKLALAAEAAGVVQQVINAANTTFRGRYLFGGTRTNSPPFELLGNGVVRYNGDGLAINSFADLELLLANNIDGQSAFGATTPPVGSDLNTALTLDSRIEDLLGGQGVTLGLITITLNNGTPETAQVDLTGAETIGEIKTRLEAAFPVPSGVLTLSVDIDPATKSGIRLTPSAGTVAVTDLSGSTVARDLGVASAATASINGGDLDPRLTLLTNLSALNGGTGIGTSGGNTFLVTSGTSTKTIDISTATTIEDLFNLLQTADRDIQVGINAAGNGLAISSRLSGSQFSIGENNDTIAADLGIRTFNGSTLLAGLNRGNGAPVDEIGPDGTLKSATVKITRRDGTTVAVELKGLKTVQQVLDAFNAVDPGVLVASLNVVGNGITILDDDGVSTGPLVIEQSNLAVALGIDGTEAGNDPSVPLVGLEVNTIEANGVLNILLSLQVALQQGSDGELTRINPLINAEALRFSVVRGEIGSRLKTIDETENRLLDEAIRLREALSIEYDTDVTQVLTDLAFQQAALQATLQVAASTLQLNLLNYL
jgi:flagellar hook-associated protein 3 FlgL